LCLIPRQHHRQSTRLFGLRKPPKVEILAFEHPLVEEHQRVQRLRLGVARNAAPDSEVL